MRTISKHALTKAGCECVAHNHHGSHECDDGRTPQNGEGGSDHPLCVVFLREAIDVLGNKIQGGHKGFRFLERCVVHLRRRFSPTPR